MTGDRTVPPLSPGSGRTAAWLFVTFAGFYLLGTGGHIYTPDGVIMFRVTKSLVEQRQLDIKELEVWPGFGGTAVDDPSIGGRRFYAKYGLGLSLAAVPAYVIGTLVAPLARDDERELFEIPYSEARRLRPFADEATVVLSDPTNFRFLWYDSSRSNFDEALQAFCVGWTNSFVVAAVVVGVFLICRQLGFSPRPSLSAAVLTGLATPVWHYSREFFAEPLGAMGLTYFLYFALRGSRVAASRWNWAVAGWVLGVAILAKVIHAVLLAPALLLLIGYARRLPAVEARTRAAGAVAGVLLIVGVIGWYHWARFGSLWQTGYGSEVQRWTTPIGEGLVGLLISPGRGLLIYFPLWILAVAAVRQFAASLRLELAFIVLCLVALLGAYAKWHQWEGGWCWGPRFLLPVIPLLVVPIAAILESPPGRTVGKLLMAAVIGIAAAVACSGLLVNYVDFYNWMQSYYATHATWFVQHGIDGYYELLRWDVRYAPIVAYWRFPAKDSFFIMHALRSPGAVLAMYAVFGGTFLVGLTQLLRGLGLFGVSRREES